MEMPLSYKEQIDVRRVPAHVAIIMDGNGRWAIAHNQRRSYGHQAGVGAVRRIVKTAAEAGVRFLTLYAFSTENWSRPQEEVATLMALLLDSVEEEIFMRNNVAFRVIGDMERLPETVRERLRQCMERTAGNSRMTMVIALSYSSRWEITQAVRRIAEKVKAGVVDTEDIDESLVSQNLSTSFMPDPDLLIRTGGEVRLSNYLLWQCAYSELYFCDTFWPDFDEEDFYKAVCSYQQRERRFGMTSEQVAGE